jgi:hypothetical protein
MGFVHVIQAFLPHLKLQGEGGHIVATASMSGMLCVPGNGPYNASKFGLVALSETLAAELAGTSIGVSVLCPGAVRTRAADSARNRPERYGPRTETPAAAAAQLAAILRAGEEPDEVAEKVMRAIKEEELYIFTHPEYRTPLEERFQRILDDRFHETDHGTGNLLADSSFVVDRTRSGIMAGWRQAVASAHISRETRAWLDTRPPGRFDFTFAGELREEALDQVEPGAVLGHLSSGQRNAAGLIFFGREAWAVDTRLGRLERQCHTAGQFLVWALTR